MGPIILDIEGVELTQEDEEILKHPLVGGVILFARNFEDTTQLKVLVNQIRHASRERLLLTVDHEGGRVQRFKEGFTSIPAARSFASVYSDSEACMAAKMAGWLIAMELTSFDIDLSFVPVLDLGHSSPAIGDRAFHTDVEVAAMLAGAMIDGLHEGGMKATGKHFPGHGAVETDTHKAIAIDARSQSEIEQDMWIFRQLIHQGKLDAVMPAHVIYPAFDVVPASGSSFWLKTVLRNQLGFQGVIFSDDLSMEGAKAMGNHADRTLASLNAGVDMALICNNRAGAIEALDLLPEIQTEKPKQLFHKNKIDYADLIKSAQWQRYHNEMMRVNDAWHTQKTYYH